MIELCSKRRMILSCGLLVVVSVIVLVIENNFSYIHGIKEATGAPDSNNETKNCWENDNSEVLEECQKCTSFELKVQEYCKETGYREKIKCISDKVPPQEIYKSCPKVTWEEERHFWVFQSVTVILGAASYLVVVLRQKRLDKLLIEKVHKQIAAGV